MLIKNYYLIQIGCVFQFTGNPILWTGTIGYSFIKPKNFSFIEFPGLTKSIVYNDNDSNGNSFALWFSFGMYVMGWFLRFLGHKYFVVMLLFYAAPKKQDKRIT